MPPDHDCLAAEFPSLAAELGQRSNNAPGAATRTPTSSPTPPAPDQATPDSRRARLAAEFPSLKEDLAQEGASTKVDPKAARLAKELPSLASELKAAGADLTAPPEGIDAGSPFYGEFKQIVADGKVSSELASKLLGVYQREVEAAEKANQEEIAKWDREVRSDPALVANQAEISRVAAEYGGDGLLKLLGETGLGSHPALVRFVHKVALALRRGSR